MCQMMLAAVFLPSELILTYMYSLEIQYLLELKKVREALDINITEKKIQTTTTKLLNFDISVLKN